MIYDGEPGGKQGWQKTPNRRWPPRRTTPEVEAEAQDPVGASGRREDTRVRLDREAPDEALRHLKRPLTELVAAVCRGFALSPEETQNA